MMNLECVYIEIIDKEQPKIFIPDAVQYNIIHISQYTIDALL